MKNISKAAFCFAFIVLMVTGCGEAEVPKLVDGPMISIAKDGAVTEYLVGEFNAKSYYDVSELYAMAMEEAAQYNTAHQTGNIVPVKVEKVEALEDQSGRVQIVYQYDSAESYTGFNEGSLFYGTVGEAAEEGYSVDISLKSAGGGEGRILTAQQDTDKRLIIAPCGMHIYCPGQVEYISENADMAEDGSVDATAAEDPVYILLK